MKRALKIFVAFLLLSAICVSMASCFEVSTEKDFSSEEQEMIYERCGFYLPFLSCSSYAFDHGSNGDFIIVSSGIKSQDLNTYLNSFSSFRAEAVKEDCYGFKCHQFSKNGWNVDVGVWYSGLLYDEVYTYVYPSSYMVENVESNYNAGLPYSESGIYNVDFKAGKYDCLKEINGYKYTCPSKGDVRVLVIPIYFSDSQNHNYLSLSSLSQSLNGENGVSGFFYDSSYGQLNLSFDVYDEWICAPFSSAEYIDYFEDSTSYDPSPVNQILLTALTELEPKLDLTRYDSDNDGCIDAVVMINPLEIDESSVFQWAYKTQNLITDISGDEYLFDNKRAFNYVWMSKDFLYENNTFKRDVIVHEFTHTLGIIDYYSTDYYFTEDPTYGKDLMSDVGEDHSPLTKFLLGWISNATLITDVSDFSVSLSSFRESGETLILANDFNVELGCFQEYFIVIYSVGDKNFDDGIVIYHVNASLINAKTYNKITTVIYNDNDAPIMDGSEDNLIEIVNGGKSISAPLNQNSSISLYDSRDEKILFSFTVTEKDANKITITSLK